MGWKYLTLVGLLSQGRPNNEKHRIMNKISWRLVLELVEAVVEAILRIFGGKSDKEKEQNKK